MKNKLSRNEDITINFVGDSITWGLHHCGAEETYVAKFTSLCAKTFENYMVRRFDGVVSDELEPIKSFDGPIFVSYKENAPKLDVIRNGVGGNTVMRAYNRIDDFTGTLANGKKPDITFLMFGINDSLAWDKQKYVTPEIFKSNYKMLIDEIRSRNPETLLILMSSTYNDYSVDEHVRKTEELAAEQSIPLIDLHTLWTNHFDEKSDHFGQGDWLANDTDACHPTPKAASIMAENIFKEFLKIIGVERN